jgi:SAM-dependent methyltransferase
MHQSERDHARQMATFDQNSQTFRSLNQLMWQVPLIAMSLTGGLWFGVAKTSSPIFQFSLLGLAALGNLVLIVVVARLRYIMDAYLVWLADFNTSGFVAAQGDKPWNGPFVVRRMFQAMFSLTAIISLGLMGVTARDAKWFQSANERSAAFYDRSAVDLVDRYEALPFAQAHPFLSDALSGKPRQRILDIGAGTGRDAAAMTALGHGVAAVEPSDAMRSIARATHPSLDIRWIDASLPRLDAQGLNDQRFDLIVLSAVWMHVHPMHRRAALERLSDLLTPGGRIYLTLRLGAADRDRAIFEVSPQELSVESARAGLTYRALAETPDLLGRPDVRWMSVVLTKPALPALAKPATP